MQKPDNRVKPGPRINQIEYHGSNPRGDDEPEEPNDDDDQVYRIINTHKNKIVKENKIRYDIQGREIKKDKKFQISFEQMVTVCIYHPDQDVLEVSRFVQDYLKQNENSSSLSCFQQRKRTQ